VVFSPEDGEVWVGTGQAPTSRGEWVCFSFDALGAAPRPSFRLDDGETDEARQAYEHDRRAYVAYLDDGDVRGAQAEMDRARALAPSEALFHLLAGLSALELGDAAGAHERLARAVELGHPHEARRAAMQLWLGRALDRLGRRDEARAAYRKALALRADPPVHAAAKKGDARPWPGGAMNVDFSLADVVQP
jgi:tetratricopeptide (TPR) repeat protein